MLSKDEILFSNPQQITEELNTHTEQLEDLDPESSKYEQVRDEADELSAQAADIIHYMEEQGYTTYSAGTIDLRKDGAWISMDVSDIDEDTKTSMGINDTEPFSNTHNIDEYIKRTSRSLETDPGDNYGKLFDALTDYSEVRKRKESTHQSNIEQRFANR